MLCQTCGRTITPNDPKVTEEALTCPYCGAHLTDKPPHDPDSAVIPDREAIDEDVTEEDD